MATIDPSQWMMRYSPSEGAELLFCFPYAGGSASIFRDWARLLPRSIEVVAIQTPGKGSRLLEQPYTRLADLVEALVGALSPALYRKPFSFFGHSNGGMIAFELSCVLQRRRLPLPRRLFLSASSAPWSRRFETPCSEMDDAEFRAMLRDLDGTPSEIIDDEELFALLLPGLRADFCMAEDYVYTHDSNLIVPTDIFYGRDDDIELQQIQAWQDRIEPAVRYEEMPGGHFYLHSHGQELTGSLVRGLGAGRASPEARAVAG